MAFYMETMFTQSSQWMLLSKVNGCIMQHHSHVSLYLRNKNVKTESDIDLLSAVTYVTICYLDLDFDRFLLLLSPEDDLEPECDLDPSLDPEEEDEELDREDPDDDLDLDRESFSSAAFALSCFSLLLSSSLPTKSYFDRSSTSSSCNHTSNEQNQQRCILSTA